MRVSLNYSSDFLTVHRLCLNKIQLLFANYSSILLHKNKDIQGGSALNSEHSLSSVSAQKLIPRWCCTKYFTQNIIFPQKNLCTLNFQNQSPASYNHQALNTSTFSHLLAPKRGHTATWISIRGHWG